MTDDQEMPSPTGGPDSSRSGMTARLSALPRAAKLGIVALALTVLLPLAYVAGDNWLTQLDTRADAIARQVVTQTATAFAVAKAINMGLSVASSTTVGLSAVGTGSVTIGQLLNPLDRLIDDFSDWLLVAA